MVEADHAAIIGEKENCRSRQKPDAGDADFRCPAHTDLT